MDKEPNRRNPAENFELSLSVVDAYEEIVALIRPFVEATADFPKSVREEMSAILTLSGEDFGKLTLELEQIFSTAEAIRGEAIPKEEKQDYIGREVGNRMFYQLFHYLLGAQLLGEMPGDVAETSDYSEFRIKYATDQFIRNIRPILVPDLISRYQED